MPARSPVWKASGRGCTPNTDWRLNSDAPDADVDHRSADARARPRAHPEIRRTGSPPGGFRVPGVHDHQSQLLLHHRSDPRGHARAASWNERGNPMNKAEAKRLLEITDENNQFDGISRP